MKTTLSIVVSESHLSFTFSFSASKSKNKSANRVLLAMFITCCHKLSCVQGKRRFDPFDNVILFCNKIVESLDKKKIQPIRKQVNKKIIKKTKKSNC